jgi:hypothetical protein
MHPCIGYSDERIEIFWAQGLIYVGHQRDHGEHLDVIEMSVADAMLAVQDGEITDGKTISALMWADKILRRLADARMNKPRPDRLARASTSIPPAATRWRRCTSSPKSPATSPTRTTSTNCSAASSAP